MHRKKIILALLLLSLAVVLLARSGPVTAAARLVGLKDDTLVYARSLDSSTLDPAAAQDEESIKVISNIFEGLVRFKPGTTEIEPCLAEAWSISPDGREWTFYLRKNVKFHDGTPFNSEAVRFSIERQMPPFRQENTAYAAFTFGVVDQIKTPDPYTVKFILKFPYTPFLHNLAMPVSAPIVSPTAASVSGDNFGEQPAGTGPYCFSTWKNNKSITLKANKDYWGKPAEQKSLAFTVIKNSRIRSLALKLGLADIIDGITPSDASYLEQKGYLVFKNPGFDLNYLGFYTDKKPFNNPAVRRAINMLIDRGHINTVLFKGNSFEANGPLPPGILGYDPNTRPLPYDPVGAKELLSKNGYSGGMKITIITYTNSRPYNPAGGEKLAQLIRDDLARGGIETEIKAYPWNEYKEALFNKEGNAFLYGWISDNCDPDNFLYTLLASSQIDNGLNAARYRNNDLDLLLARAQREIEPALREQLYRRAVEIIINDSPWVVFNHSLKHLAISPRVDGLVPCSTGYVFLDSVKKN